MIKQDVNTTPDSKQRLMAVSHLVKNRFAKTLTKTVKSLLACTIFSALVITANLNTAFAGEADVVDATISALGDGRYRIDTTVQHADTGWDHYADRWDVLAPDGTVLGVRELAHPHVNEQPFTRSLTLEIPAGITTITLRANDSVHGLGGKTMQLQVPSS